MQHVNLRGTYGTGAPIQTPSRTSPRGERGALEDAPDLGDSQIKIVAARGQGIVTYSMHVIHNFSFHE